MNLVVKLLEKFFSFSRKDYFLILEISAHFSRGVLLKVSFDRKKLEIVKAASADMPLARDQEFIEGLKKLLRNFGKLNRLKVILSLDPGLATTIHSNVLLVRDRPSQPIDDSDLDNRIAQGIWRIFDRERSRAAAKMNVGDLDVLLTHVSVKKIKIDGHTVINPLDFKARTIEIHFNQTFSTRKFTSEIKKLIPGNQLVLMAENGVLAADALLKTGEDAKFLLLDILNDRTNLFLSTGTSVSYLNSVKWGRENLVRALSSFFSVSSTVAEKILELYLIRQASPIMLKRVERLLAIEFGRLMAVTQESFLKHELSAVYLFSFFELPEFVFGPGFKNQFLRKARILPVNHQIIIEKLGFEVLQGTSLVNLFSPLASFFGFYFRPQNDKINAVADRHARWLIN